MSQTAHHAAIQDITTCLNTGLQHHIGKRYILSQIAGAHEMMESGKAIGNLVIGIIDINTH